MLQYTLIWLKHKNFNSYKKVMLTSFIQLEPKILGGTLIAHQLYTLWLLLCHIGWQAQMQAKILSPHLYRWAVTVSSIMLTSQAFSTTSGVAGISVDRIMKILKYLPKISDHKYKDDIHESLTQRDKSWFSPLFPACFYGMTHSMEESWRHGHWRLTNT